MSTRGSGSGEDLHARSVIVGALLGGVIALAGVLLALALVRPQLFGPWLGARSDGTRSATRPGAAPGGEGIAGARSGTTTPAEEATAARPTERSRPGVVAAIDEPGRAPSEVAPGAAASARPPARRPSEVAPGEAAVAVPSGWGMIRGEVRYAGAPPLPLPLNTAADPFCARRSLRDEIALVDGEGHLRNVVVYVRDAPRLPLPPAPTTPAAIEQRDCRYAPRVQAIRSGQPLQIRNADGTLHNVHVYKGSTTLFNQAQIPDGPIIEKQFNGPFDLLKFKCDVHPWMTGFVYVFDHPYYAVTGDDGRFAIALPAGEHKVTAWHEHFGTREASVVVAPDGLAEARFEFDGSPAGH